MATAHLPERAAAENAAAELEALREENQNLRLHIRDMQKGTTLGQQLVARQFMEVDRILTLLQDENTLRKSLLDATDQLSIIYADATGTVRMFNRGAEALLGYASEEVVGTARLLDFLPAADIEAIERQTGTIGIQSLIALTRRGTLKTREWSYLNRSGETIPVNLSISLVHDLDDKVTGLVCSAMDIIEIKKAEALERQEAAEILQLSEQRFSVIFHSSPVPLSVVETTAEGKLVDINEAWLQLFGLTREQVLGRTGLEFAFWKDPADRRELYRRISEQDSFSDFEAWLIRSDAAEPILCKASGRRFQLGEKRFAIFCFEDITAQRQAEAALREFNVTLENRVTERTEALQGALAELGKVIDNLEQTQDELVRSEKLAGLGSMVAGIAHELNTPIGNSLMVSTHLVEGCQRMCEAMQGGLRRSTLDEFLADVSSASDILARNLHKAAELISSFKKVAVDQTSSQRREFSLREVIAEVVLTMGPGLRQSRCIVEQDVADNIPMDSYPGPLGQILTNLINNAVLHGFDGREGGLVRVTAAAPDATGRTRLVVSDNGKGIPDHVLPRIFDPFFTTKLGLGGSGLGLNIVHNMVTGLLGGRIGVESLVGQGTRFTLTLPLIAPQHAEKPAGRAPVSASRTRVP